MTNQTGLSISTMGFLLFLLLVVSILITPFAAVYPISFIPLLFQLLVVLFAFRRLSKRKKKEKGIGGGAVVAGLHTLIFLVIAFLFGFVSLQQHEDDDAKRLGIAAKRISNAILFKTGMDEYVTPFVIPQSIEYKSNESFENDNRKKAAESLEEAQGVKIEIE